MAERMLKIPETAHTPGILFDFDGGACRVWGKSFPENAEKFYRPIIDWLENLAAESGPAAHPISFEFSLYYINSSSVFTVLELITNVKRLTEVGWNITVTWQYDVDDEDIRKIGEDYSNLTQLEMQLVALTEEE